MFHAARETQLPSRVITAAPVLPAYRHHAEYVGVLQWCDGPNVQPIPGEAPSIIFTLKTKAANGHGTEFHFRALKHTLSLLDCTKKNGDAAVLKAFTELCNDQRILKTLGQPFASALVDDKARQGIIDVITDQFNHLHEN